MTVDKGEREPARALGRRTNNVVGVVLILIAFFFHSLSDVGSKMLSESHHPMQLAWVRMLGLVLGAAFLVGTRGVSILRTRYPGLQVFRGLLVVISAISYLFALAYVPMADAVAVTFVAPFVVIVLAAIILKEKVGPARWVAVIIGFAGTLIVIRPGAGVLHPAIFLSLVAGASFAIRQVISRFVAGKDPLATTVIYTTITAFVVLCLPLPFVWKSPATLDHFVIMVGIACLTGAGEYLVMRALDVAEAIVVAPLLYTIMIWSTLWGVLFFGTFPDAWTFTGSALVIGSGIFTIYMDWRNSRKRVSGGPGAV